MLNNNIIMKYIRLTIKHELKVLQWIPPPNGLVEIRITKDNKNKGTSFKLKNIKNIIINFVKSPKTTCSEYWILSKSFLVKEELFFSKYLDINVDSDFIILTSLVFK